MPLLLWGPSSGATDLAVADAGPRLSGDVWVVTSLGGPELCRFGVEVIDHHFCCDGSCCLGLLYHPEPHLTIDRFMTELVAPFFYRLSYASKFSVEAARSDHWGEYSHGDVGCYEYHMELRRIASQRPRRNDACPCGEGEMDKRCHMYEVEAFMRDLLRSRRTR